MAKSSQSQDPETYPENPKNVTEEVRIFYDFLLDRQPISKEAFNNYYIFGTEFLKTDVVSVHQKINEYIERTPGTKVTVVMQAAGNQIVTDMLIGFDPIGDLFIVIDTKEDLPQV